MCKYLRYTIIPLFMIAVLRIGRVESYRSMSTVKNLYNNILSGYDTRIRPRLDQAVEVIVSSRFIPNNIIEFDTTEQRFSLLGSIKMTWSDEVLTWDPKVYEGTESVKIPLNEIWKPSLILMKAFDGDGVIGEANSDVASVSYDGTVTWTPDGIFSYVCEVDIQYYPFDEQRCTLTYYVSDETIRSVSLWHNETVLMDEFIENSEWNLVDVQQSWYEDYDTRFIEVYFTVQRRANFATFTMIVPLLMLAFLNICVFLVPIDSGEKGSFSITIFLSYGIFVSIVSDTLPHNSLQVSFFVLFLIVLLLFSVLSVFYTIMQAKLFAAIGEDECKIGICAPFKNKVEPEKKEKQPDDEESRMSTPVVGGAMKKGVVVVTPYDEAEMDEFGGEKADDAKNEDLFTWRKFLERLDTVLFCLFFVLIVISTTVFFCLMMQNLGKDGFKQG